MRKIGEVHLLTIMIIDVYGGRLIRTLPPFLFFFVTSYFFRGMSIMASEKIFSVSSDISFCMSDCTDTECSRNQGSVCYGNRIREWYSCANFSNCCDDYKKAGDMKRNE